MLTKGGGPLFRRAAIISGGNVEHDYGADLRKEKDKEVIKKEDVGKVEDILTELKKKEEDPLVVERRRF